MKITKKALKEIIKEEIEAVLQEDEIQEEEYNRDAAIAQLNAAMAEPMTKDEN
jgi:thiamine biosynthesis lipoprotein ApbE